MKMVTNNIPYNKIRDHYEYLTPTILERYDKRKAAWITPYCHDVRWESIFTPIEDMTWQVIRSFGLCPMYPQYPVGKYFVDFGHPGAKIAIECDGKDYHLDKEKDMRRDVTLFKMGWLTYRIPGKDCVRVADQKYYDLDHYGPERRGKILSDFYNTTIDGLIKAIAIRHFGYKSYWEDEYLNELNLVDRCVDIRLSKACVDPYSEYYKTKYDDSSN